ncbi:chorismate-binding protein [Ornithinimicrobium sp. F0845]|uniref:chorismate-binding protein n=1 Tax=Ornithinimicrobium sp. F0845 TaxID=2926412 RepID=UPI001FF17DA7|nr:chorismate-binding protein [Ornithinimicrobium sp. F0845]MCK0110654.1 chorismate-binding protein [Ornithinimicrobium sp. F0845]
MSSAHPLLDRVLADPAGLPWALLWREEGPDIELLVGDVRDVGLLADIPPATPDRPVLAMVPFRQITERGFDAHDDGAPLRLLVATETERIPAEVAIGILPAEPVEVTGEHFSVSDEEYAGIVTRVIEDEIGNGEGANFVIRRDVVAHTDVPAAVAALTWFRTLLVDERGTYWTFAVHTPGHTLVGATPERHVSVRDGRVRMNPISGTFRHPADGTTLEESFRRFIADTKETEELFMVVDEEMKMMAQICTDGGRITGPYLKQMAHLTHTEYLLDGRAEADPRDVLRATMFAPTVTGSPMENACTVIRRHEPGGRRYYSGVLALLEREGDGRSMPRRPGVVDPEVAAGPESLDAPILIRAAHLADDGTVTVSAGATLVRHSDPVSEVAETTAKASGMLAALGLRPRREVRETPVLAELPGVAEVLEARNESLAAFWLSPQEPRPDPELVGHEVLVVDAEDMWTQMLAHQLRHLGLSARVVRWDRVAPADLTTPDLVLFGPGPGDPADPDDPRMERLRELIGARMADGRPLLAVCLSHQVLARMAGLEIAKLPAPNQGVQIEVDLWGTPARIGFYNTFVAHPGRAALDRAGEPVVLEVATDRRHGVVALRGPGVATIQGHAESVLSRDGLVSLHAMIRHALGLDR